jgi:hypothetical protein
MIMQRIPQIDQAAASSEVAVGQKAWSPASDAMLEEHPIATARRTQQER